MVTRANDERCLWGRKVFFMFEWKLLNLMTNQTIGTDDYKTSLEIFRIFSPLTLFFYLNPHSIQFQNHFTSDCKHLEARRDFDMKKVFLHLKFRSLQAFQLPKSKGSLCQSLISVSRFELRYSFCLFLFSHPELSGGWCTPLKVSRLKVFEWRHLSQIFCQEFTFSRNAFGIHSTLFAIDLKRNSKLLSLTKAFLL